MKYLISVFLIFYSFSSFSSEATCEEIAGAAFVLKMKALMTPALEKEMTRKSEKPRKLLSNFDCAKLVKLNLSQQKNHHIKLCKSYRDPKDRKAMFDAFDIDKKFIKKDIQMIVKTLLDREEKDSAAAVTEVAKMIYMKKNTSKDICIMYMEKLGPYHLPALDAMFKRTNEKR